LTKVINAQRYEIDTLIEELEQYEDKIDQLQRGLEHKELDMAKQLKLVEKTRFDTEERLLKRISSEILPLLNEIMDEKITDRVRAKLSLVKTRLTMFIPSSSNTKNILSFLTPMEAQVASMVKSGYTSLNISNILNISLLTVKSHRLSIRRKLSLTNKEIDLSLYLQNILE
jgi:DNA-binding CsgD family transcriptional regulator